MSDRKRRAGRRMSMADIGSPIKEITVTPQTIPVPGPVPAMPLPAPVQEPVPA